MNDLLASGCLKRHSASAHETSNLLLLADQYLQDAKVEAISLDLRFSAAYQAALQLATIPLYCAGYRTSGAGHYATVFEALPLAMSDEYKSLAAHFEACRLKRNVAEYQRVGLISRTELAELVATTERFRAQVGEWLRENHPALWRG